MLLIGLLTVLNVAQARGASPAAAAVVTSTSTTQSNIYDAASKKSPATSLVSLRSGAGAEHQARATGSSSPLTAGIVAADTAGALTESQIGSTPEDILANATRGNVSKAAQYIKTGGMDQANSDFDLLIAGPREFVLSYVGDAAASHRQFIDFLEGHFEAMQPVLRRAAGYMDWIGESG